MVVKWEQYQEDAAGFFRSMQVRAETNFPVHGARGKHMLDGFVKGAIQRYTQPRGPRASRMLRLSRADRRNR